MIKYLSKKEPFFDTYADILVNPVNCIGVSGAGLALAFKQIYPKQVETYALACRTGHVKIGKGLHRKAPDGKAIYFFPTKSTLKIRLNYLELKPLSKTSKGTSCL